MSYTGNQCFEGIRSLPAKGATAFVVGQFAMVKAGYMIPGQVTTGAIVRGTTAQSLDTTGLADGDAALCFNVGDAFGKTWDVPNSGADAVTQAQCGIGYCYVSGAYEVAGTDGGATRSIAGVPLKLKQNGTIVEIAILPLSVVP